MEFKRDANWVRQSFLLPRRGIDAVDAVRRTYSNGYRKFTDTTLGGNFAINSPYQFTPFADIPEKRIHTNLSLPMGRWYSEVIDDNSIHVHLRFGVAQYNSWTSFFGNFYSPELSRLARTGRGTGLFYTLGKLAGYVVALPFIAPILIGQVIKFLVNKPSTKFYYLKPTMPLYWNAVTMITNYMAANMGFIQGQGFEDYQKDSIGLTAQDIADRNFLLPDTFRADGGIDIYRIATKAQRLADQQNKALAKMREEAGSVQDLRDRFVKYQNTERTDVPEGNRLADYLDKYLGMSSTAPEGDKVVEVPNDAGKATEGVPTKVFTEPSEDVSSYYGDFDPTGQKGKEDPGLVDFLIAEARDGAQFITFRVADPGEVGESFSSTVKDSDISGTINSISQGARNSRFTFANGNLDDGIIATTVKGIVGAVTDVVAGLADSLSISGLASLAGNAMVDIPKHWDQSTANLPKATYTIELRTPYGNDLSRYQDLLVPLAFLLAGALPLSAGPSSFTSPFLCELFCKGRHQFRLGMIDSLDIRRGTGNLGWTQDSKPLGIDITVSFVDMSSIIHMPLTTMFKPWEPFTPGGIQRMFTADESAFSNYMAVLCSLGLSEQIYAWSGRLKRNYYRQVLNYNSWFNKAHFANWAFGTFPGQLMSLFAENTNRP
jgi:hypothetical protein